MAVIEALMSLFIKELVTADRVVTTIKRFILTDGRESRLLELYLPHVSDPLEYINTILATTCSAY